MRFIVLILLLSASLNVNADAYVMNWAKPKKGGPEGCVTGSVGILKDPSFDKNYHGLTLFFQEPQLFDANNSKFSVQYIHNRPVSKSNNYNDAYSYGVIFIVCVKPGIYNLVSLTTRDGIMESSSVHPFEMPFTVEAGKNIYIGSFTRNLGKPQKNCRGTPLQQFVQFSNESQRDIPLIMASKKHPSTIPDVSLLMPGNYNPYIVSCDSILQN